MSDFLFSDETLSDEIETKPKDDKWHILIIDDEQDIHQVTKLVLSDFRFSEKRLEFHHAYSAKEAMAFLEKGDVDVAVALVDVVMETNHAGLDLIKYIREHLGKSEVRLILRTGQPGEAPEEAVIRDYDINDYKNKTELTSVKLKTLLYSALRSYRDILTINRAKNGLERIITASSTFLQCSSVNEFASTILNHVTDIMGIPDTEIYCVAAVNSESNPPQDFTLLAASGDHHQSKNGKIPDNVVNSIISARQKHASSCDDKTYIGYFHTQGGMETMLYVSKESNLQETDFHLLEFFANNIAMAYDNLRLREIIKESQKELSYILGEAVEKRSKETGSHVKRVAHYSQLLGQLYGLSNYHCEILKLASPLHDVGKISIPDRILNKPGKLDADEWAIMQTHAQMGYEILKNSQNEILQCGATIAHEHHEKWDGSGYPRGLHGENINIVGRITALADVFDALGSDRCYKPAWPMEKIISLVNQEKGKHFDPNLVELFIANLGKFIEIRDSYPD
ncbi:Response regulator [Pseudoalteromonas luteoviolacea B = ATCC 29581]|nr:Response regulator [Pseudoalteromonas luteoviolacea B = ATCC 29581]